MEVTSNHKKELNEYYNILCNGDYPSFIDKYFNTYELNRLKNIGQFCGCDYSKLYNIRYWYSRFDHSVATALITWNFTKDKAQTLSALFHDLGTPSFSHCIDFLLGDSINQETSEKSVKDIISNSKEIKNLLELDGFTIEQVSDVSIYPIVENKSPKLCVDRLEGVLHTVYIWLNTWGLEQIKKTYQGLEVLINEDNIKELGFNNVSSGELFFKAVYEYSIALQSNEDKYTMQYIADALKRLIELKKLNLIDLYKLSESNIIKLIKENDPTWNIFTEARVLNRSNTKPKGVYSVSIESKKRYVVPLCKKDNKSVRLDIVSKNTNKLLLEYTNFKDSKYSYMEGIINETK